MKSGKNCKGVVITINENGSASFLNKQKKILTKHKQSLVNKEKK